MRRSLRFIVLMVTVGALASCSTTDESNLASPVDDVAAPLPTIGLDSDLGSISGGTELRRIDTGDVDRVVMIGDSITVGAQPLIEEQLDTLGFAEVNVVAQELKRIAVSFGDNSSGADIAAFIAQDDEVESDEQLWVVALGTNDIGQYESSDEVRDIVETTLDEIPSDAPLVWINTYFADRPDGTSEMNDAIDRALSERGNATVGRWDEIAPTDGVLRGDGVHPNTEGAEVFAAFVTNTVANHLQR